MLFFSDHTFVRKPGLRRKNTQESVNFLAGVDAPHTGMPFDIIEPFMRRCDGKGVRRLWHIKFQNEK